jgi:hypothetical protein
MMDDWVPEDVAREVKKAEDHVSGAALVAQFAAAFKSASGPTTRYGADDYEDFEDYDDDEDYDGEGGWVSERIAPAVAGLDRGV